MTSVNRSPRVVGAHFYARYGYDEAMRQVSSNLRCDCTDKELAFWKQVFVVVEALKDEDDNLAPPQAQAQGKGAALN